MSQHAVYGAPPPALAVAPEGALQISPLHPGGTDLETLPDNALASVTMLAPPGVLERRFAIAHALRAARPDAPFIVLAPKDKGGSRLKAELSAFGCAVSEDAKAHHRICTFARPQTPSGLEEAIAAGAMRSAPDLSGLWTQPGVFSWNRLDPGSALLIETLPALSGAGADFGCGLGVLARAVLKSSAVQRVDLVDTDSRALACARRNVVDGRAAFHWSDVRNTPLANLDFVVMNPPFHDGGAEDRALGAGFIARARACLRRGGRLWLVANRHLPYEAVLRTHFARSEQRAQAHGFKVFEATA